MSDYKKMDLVERGNYSPSPLGTTVFIGLRLLDGFVLQRALQVLNPIPALFAKLGLAIPPPPPSGGPSLAMSTHDLTPFQAVIWAMSIGAALKQTFWIAYVSKEQMTPQNALIICTFNTLVNSVNTLAFSLAGINPTWSESVLRISAPLYVAGILIETVSEVQRKWFKDDPKNQGKPYSGGLFGYARSINYFGYTIWRSAAAAAGGGLVWGVLSMAWLSLEFVGRAIPVMDEYCTSRYGVQWEALKKKVPYAFCPFIY